jgi:Flp pilus assembly protein TadD
MFEYLYPILSVVISIVSLVIFFIVLIKSFKAGALKGILGIITCGFFTFIWGWVKHKELQLTKLMLLWTVLIILSIVIPVMVGTAQFMTLAPMIQEQTGFITGQKNLKLSSKRKKKSRVAKKKRTSRKKTKKQTRAERKKDDWNSRAVALWKKGKYTKPNQAINYLDKAIAKNPQFAEAYNNRGNAYRDLNQLQKAFADYNQAIRIKPNYVEAYNNRGNIYYDLKKYQLAIKDYKKSISLKPNYRLAYLNRGLAYHKLKQNNLACMDLKKACQLGDCKGLNWAKQNKICPK